MQTQNYDGSYGTVVKVQPETIAKEVEDMLNDSKVQAVNIFKASNQEIRHHNKFRSGKQFKRFHNGIKR